MTDNHDALRRLRQIRIDPHNDPVAAVTEDDARRASVTHPRLAHIAPVYGAAEHLDGARWRVIAYRDVQPQGARDGLTSYFRERAAETDDPMLRSEYEAAYTRLEWEKINELSVGGRRIRVIRIDRFIRLGSNGPEPPRPSDLDPLSRQRTRASRTEGFVLDPDAATGWADAALRMQVLQAAYPASKVPEAVRADSLRALSEYPGGVLLPVEFAVGEHVDGQWEPLVVTHASPQDARDKIASGLRFDVTHGPTLGGPELDEAHRQLYLETADRIEADRHWNEVTVGGRTLQVVRVGQFVRVSPDGPEQPRSSDPDPELPIEVQAQQAAGSYE